VCGGGGGGGGGGGARSNGRRSSHSLLFYSYSVFLLISNYSVKIFHFVNKSSATCCNFQGA